MSGPDDTNDLLVAAGAGNESAREALWARHRERLRKLVAPRIDSGLARRFDASDVVQDVLVEANRRLSDYLQAAQIPFPVWLQLLARNRLIDMQRQHRVAARRSVSREQAVEPAAGEHSSLMERFEAVDRNPTPAAAALHMELEARFQAAIEALDSSDREVVVLRHFERLPNQEVAALLGVSDAAAAMRYLRAMRRLRTLMQTE